MKLIVGLGNIGPEYHLTRHNIGFILLNHAAEEFDASWHEKSKFKALIAETRFGAEKVLFAKPTTYYNLSGESVRLIVDFYKLTTKDILVVHDELALPFGTLRTRWGGSDAGNNGIKNITQYISDQYGRIRVGIANTMSASQKAESFVLEKFTEEERERLTTLAEHTARFIEDFIHEDKEFSHTSLRLA